jgi:hypothetical protein
MRQRAGRVENREQNDASSNRIPVRSRCPPDGDKFTDPTYQKLLRLLDSAALVLRDACAAADFRAVKDVVGVYIGIDWPDFDPPFQWREDIPNLAEEYGRSKEASTVAA